jgi:exodeoxyribonuclease-3
MGLSVLGVCTWKRPEKYPRAPAIPAPALGLACPRDAVHLAGKMKIASFNINNIRKRLPNLLAWLDESVPDVVCLQELKATDADFPIEALRGAGYEAVWRGQKSWNGVAILARRTPILTCEGLPGDSDDKQSRYIEAAVNGVTIASAYAPNGNPQPGPKFEYKLAWLERLAARAAELYETGVPVVLAGDYNVVPTNRDIYPTKSWDNDALLQPESRAAYDRIVVQGWIDAIRKLHPTEPMYTFWDYMRNRWERDGGLRLDHILLSRALADRLQDAGVDRAVRGKDNASDHAPVWVVLRDISNARRGRGGRSGKRDGASIAATREPSPKSVHPATTQAAPSARPLLVIDGDSFAHRSYHALPKSILRKDGKGGGAIVGFANFLLRPYEAERPRTVLVAGDIWANLTLSAFTLLVPPLGMAVGVTYLSSPPPRGPEQQRAERADMRPKLATSQHPVAVEKPPFEERRATFTPSEVTKDPTRYKESLQIETPPAAATADLAANVPEQVSAASRRLPARARTPVAAVEEQVASVGSAPRANESGTWVVQLSAQATEEAALSAFHAAQAKYAALAGYQVLIRKKDQGARGVFYAAQVGPLARDEANDLCGRIKSARGKCFTLEN